MEPVGQVAAVVTIASGCIATSIAVGGLTAKFCSHIYHNKKLIKTRFRELLSHLHETTVDPEAKIKNDDAKHGVSGFIRKWWKIGNVKVKKLTHGKTNVMGHVLHPDALAKTLLDLTDLVKMYEEEFKQCSLLQLHIGMHATISGASLIASQVMDIADVFNSGIQLIDRSHIPAVIETFLRDIGVTGDLDVSTKLDEILYAFTLFLNALITFDRDAEQYPDYCTLGEDQHGHRRTFGLWMHDQKGAGVMRHTLKRLRDEIRDLLTDVDFPHVGGKTKRHTAKSDVAIVPDAYASSSSSSRDDTVMSDEPTHETKKKKKPLKKRQKITDIE